MLEKRKSLHYYTNRHACFLLGYHLVLVTKYRKPVLTGKVGELVYGLIRELCEARGYRILDLNGEPDHIHLLFEALPQMSPMEFVNVVKTKTARFARRDFPDELLKYYPKPYFWSASYFIATVSEQSLQVASEYIKNQ